MGKPYESMWTIFNAYDGSSYIFKLIFILCEWYTEIVFIISDIRKLTKETSNLLSQSPYTAIPLPWGSYLSKYIYIYIYMALLLHRKAAGGELESPWGWRASTQSGGQREIPESEQDQTATLQGRFPLQGAVARQGEEDGGLAWRIRVWTG